MVWKVALLRRILGVPVGKGVTMSQECVLTTKRVVSKSKEVMVPLSVFSYGLPNSKVWWTY